MESIIVAGQGETLPGRRCFHEDNVARNAPGWRDDLPGPEVPLRKGTIRKSCIKPAGLRILDGCPESSLQLGKVEYGPSVGRIVNPAEIVAGQGHDARSFRR